VANAAAPAPPVSGITSPAGGLHDTTSAEQEPSKRAGGAETGQAAVAQGSAVPRHAVQAAQAAGWRPNKLTGPGAPVRTLPAEVANPPQVITPPQATMHVMVSVCQITAQ